MNGSALHLNLLKADEMRSSSPVRMRVMMPMLAMLACIAALVWWGALITQTMIVKAQSQAMEDDIAAKKAEHSGVIAQQDLVRELRMQLDQLTCYSNGIRAVGRPLAALAETMPVRVQLVQLSIPEPPPQDLTPPNKKGPPRWGPPSNVETQKLVVVGRTTKETPVVALMESLEGPEFSALVTKERKVNSFRQDATPAKDGKRLLSFEIEYAMPGRRFAK